MTPLKLLPIVALMVGSSFCFAQPAIKLDTKPDTATIRWLEERSMLFQAKAAAREVSGSSVQWRHPYGEPRPDLLIKEALIASELYIWKLCEGL